ncbi:EAL domain-containing protein [Pseudomonas sp. RW405]|uniref:EAL domain-containing protein n=1 Tax=Pseudomonas sp. RW405 TaxID=2202652 RepID=UPI000D73625E|nr:EAL domain-containing protein [Pseudomonas sp. RW405]PWY45613.1 hypothetical protein DK184_13430 [Pseudomonas sp. RW405]
MGDGLGFDVISEGVENEAQRHVLIDLGCLAFQGYLFGRPLPADTLTECHMPHAGCPETMTTESPRSA